jgi:hypothetical protein
MNPCNNDGAVNFGSVTGDYKTLDLVALFKSRGLKVYAARPGGKYLVECPWAREHSSDSTSSTVIWQDGSKWPSFHCSHDHCSHRKFNAIRECFGDDAINSYCAREFDANSHHFKPRQHTATVCEPPKPTRDDELIDSIVFGSNVTAHDLWEASTIQFNDDRSAAAYVIEQLFQPDDIVFLADAKNTGLARRLFAHKCFGCDFSQRTFIVPNPIKQCRPTKDHWLARSDDNVAEVRWYVLEWDIERLNKKTGEPTAWAPLIEAWERAGISIRDANARLINHIARFVDPGMIVDTGGKSLHTWIPALMMSDKSSADFSAYIVRLGADNCLTKISQQFRMPGGLRDGGNSQSVLYYDPSIINQNRKLYSK